MNFREKKAYCRDCGSEVRFVATRRGSWIPVDVGNQIEYDECDPGLRIITSQGDITTVTEGISHPEIYGDIIHFDTCINRSKYKEI